MKIFQKIVTIAALLGGLTTAIQAQVLIGGFQGAGDPTDAGWTDVNGGASITTDTNCAFVSGVVPGYAQSLAISVPSANAGSFGYPSIKLSFSPAQIQAFNTNSWVTFTFSVPTNNAGGYSQIYNLAFNASTYGYNNLSWSTVMETGSTNNDSAGSGPNFYFSAGSAARTQVVTVNYSAITNAIITGGEGYLQMTLQGNQGGGAPISPAWYLNNVVLSTQPFGTAATANIFVVDNFSTNGVGPENPTNLDYYTSTNVYEAGQITNVWWNWFGGAFANTAWNTNQNNPATGTPGALEVDLNWTAGSQFVLWEQGPNNDDYNIPNVSSLTYTSLEMDVKWDPSSVSYLGSQTYSNYGPLRVGERPSSYGQDWLPFANGLANTNIAVGNTNWTHLIVPLNPANSDQNNFQGILIGADTASYAASEFVGPAKLYVDNIEFKGPLTSLKIPAPTLSVQKVTPGLELYAGSIVNTYDRSDLVTVDQNQSWIGGAGYPVSYAFSLLSYPNNNINQTMLELIPVNSLNGNATYGNEYGDYQAGNGLWLVIAPNGGGAVTAAVEWKTNYPNANPGIGTLGTTNYNPNWEPLLITNSTAIGNWLLKFNSATTGSLTPPGGTPQNFTIADPNAASDFANPVIAQFGNQPNSTAGEGLYETWGYIGVTNVEDGNEYEDFTHESSDLLPNEVSGYNTTPSGEFNTANSANQASQIMAIIIRTNADLYAVSWTTPEGLYTNLVTSTNLLLAPATHWVAPTYYSSGADDVAPRGSPEPEGNNLVEIIPADNAATVNGQPGGPIAPNAFFLLTTQPPSSTP
jgi:hypothetical protein